MPAGVIYKFEDGFKIEPKVFHCKNFGIMEKIGPPKYKNTVVKIDMKDFHLLGEKLIQEENDAKDAKIYKSIKKNYYFLNK